MCPRTIPSAILLAAAFASIGGRSGADTPRTGVVIETVEAGGAAAAAGLRPNDLLRSWARRGPDAGPGEDQGQFTSPFQIPEVEMEQAPLGRVSVVLERARARLSLDLPPGRWMMRARPGFAGDVLSTYGMAAGAVKAADRKRAADSLRELASRADLSRVETAWLRQRAASWLLETGDRDQARTLFDQAVRSFENDPGLAVTLRYLEGELWENGKRYEEAAVAYGEAIAAARRLRPGRLTEAAALLRLGNVSRLRGNMKAALEHFQEALTIGEAIAPQSVEVARMLTRLGMASTSRAQPGDFDRAGEHLRKALQIERAAGADLLDTASTLVGLGNLARVRQDLDAAESHYLEALAIQERVAPDGLDHATTLMNLGAIAWYRGDVAANERYYRRGLQGHERLAPDSLTLASTLDNVGNVTGQRGNLANAEELLQRALAIRQRLAPDSEAVAHTLNNLGVIACHRRTFRAAEEYFRGALQIRERLAPQSLRVASSLVNMGYVMGKHGDLAAAVDYYRRSLAISERVSPDNTEVASGLKDLGEAELARGDFDSAETHLRRALDLWTMLAPGGMEISEVLNSLGETARGRGDIPAALEFHHQALAIRERLAPGSHFVGESAAAIARDYRKAGDLEAALAFFGRAVDAIEDQQGRLGGVEEDRSAFRAGQAGIYRELVTVLAGMGRNEEAFRAVERSRAQGFLGLLAERDLVFSDIPEELERERRALAAEFDRVLETAGKSSPGKEEPGTQVADLQKIRRRQAEIREEIRRRSPRLAALRHPAPLDVAATRRALDPGTALLSFSVGADATHLFIVDRQGRLVVERLPLGDAALRKEVEGFRAALAKSRGTAAATDAARLGVRLFQVLFGPAVARIASAERLLIVPDGPLHLLPFAALVGPDDTGAARPRYLVEWKPFHLVASATVYGELLETRNEHRETRSPVLLAFGDPRYPPASGGAGGIGGVAGDPALRSLVAKGGALNPLPASRKEVEAIVGLFGGKAQAFVGKEATEERARSAGKGPRFIHFAAHGLIDPEFPLDSAIVLSIPERIDYGRDNGLLQAWEIFESVRIEADLVTLSACETALGREVAGEGILGLTRAFHYAGARSVVASLWGVADRSTADLMKRFYAHLGQGRPKDEALRAAQIDMIRGPTAQDDSRDLRGIRLPEQGKGAAGRYASPFYWAAFQLYGDWR